MTLSSLAPRRVPGADDPESGSAYVIPASASKRARALAAAVALSAATICHAQTLPSSPASFPPRETPNWRSVPAKSLPNYPSTSLGAQDPIIAWNGPAGEVSEGRDYRVAVEAFLLADGDPSVVDPPLRLALRSLGDFEFTTTEDPLGRWPPAWFEVLVSRRPDLCRVLFERNIKPSLDAVFANNRYSAEEKQERARRAWSNHVGGVWPQLRASLPEFQAAYPVTRAVWKRSYGLISQGESAIVVEIMDVSAVFSRPATALRIGQTDTYANGGSGLRNFFNFGSLGGAPESATRSARFVPASVFESLRSTLVTAVGEERVRVAAEPEEWALTRGYCDIGKPDQPGAGRPDERPQ